MKKKANKLKGFIPVVVVVIVAIILMVVGGKVSKQAAVNFFSVANELVNKKNTNFNYTVALSRIEESAADKEKEQEEADTEEASSESADDETSEENDHEEFKSEESNRTNISDDWTNSQGISTSGDGNKWNVQLGISGNTVDKNSYVSINLTTGAVKEAPLFTYYHVDGTHYIGVGDTKKTLADSGVTELINISQTMPDGVQYITMSDDNFKILTGLNEDNGSAFLTNKDAAVTLVQDFINLYIGNLKTLVNKKALSKERGSEDNQIVVGIDVKGEDGLSLTTALRNTYANIGHNYDSFLDNLVKAKLITEEQKTGGLSEKDNLVSLVSDNWVKLNNTTVEELKARNNVLKGTITRSGDKYRTNMSLSFVRNGYQYSMSVIGDTKNGGGDAIVAPRGTAVDITTLENGYETYKGVYLGVLDYCNIFDTELSKKLSVGLSDVSDYTLNNLVTILNQRNATTDGWVPLTRDTLQGYVESHKEDPTVVELCNNLGILNLANNVTVKTTNLPQFGTLVSKFGDVQVIANVDQKADDMDKKLEVTITAINKGDKEVSIVPTDFSLKDSEGNKISANNVEQMTELYGGFDTSVFVPEYIVPVGGYIDGRLYFVTPKPNVKYDLYYKDKKLGNIEAY